MDTTQYCPQTIQYMMQYTVSIKLHFIDTVYCAIVTLIVQGRADEPLARGKISLAHDIHWSKFTCSSLALPAPLYCKEYACIHTYLTTYRLHMNYRSYQITTQWNIIYTNRQRCEVFTGYLPLGRRPGGELGEYVTVFCLLSCMGVKLGRWHWGRNVGWGCLRIGCWREYFGLRGTR